MQIQKEIIGKLLLQPLKPMKVLISKLFFMNNKKLEIKPGSPLRTIINNQFLTNRRFCKWFFKIFSKIELKIVSEYFYEDLAKRTEIIWFKEWFLEWYPSECNSFQNIVVLSII